jgi:hypothetical protein
MWLSRRKTQIFNDKNVTHNMMILKKYDCHMDNVLIMMYVYILLCFVSHYHTESLISTHNMPMCTAT